MIDLDALERAAMREAELPGDLDQPTQLLYLSLRSLYREYHAGHINKDAAKADKTKLLTEYKPAKLMYDIANETTLMRRRFEDTMEEANKNGCDICSKLARIWDGRDRA